MTVATLVESLRRVTRWQRPPQNSRCLATLGASITDGTGATRPLLQRLHQHFAAADVDVTRLMGERSVLIAYDYFFPSNFPLLDGSPETAARAATAILEDWISRHDYIIVGNLLDLKALRPTAREMLDAQEAPPRYQNLRNVYAWLYKHSNPRTHAAQAVTRALAEFAAALPDRVFIVPTEDFVNTIDFKRGGYVGARGECPAVPPNHMFADQIHFNDRGQALLYNIGLKPALERIPALRGRLPLMVSSSELL